MCERKYSLIKLLDRMYSDYPKIILLFFGYISMLIIITILYLFLPVEIVNNILGVIVIMLMVYTLGICVS